MRFYKTKITKSTCIRNINPTNLTEFTDNQAFTITGTKFGSTTGDITVMFGSQICPVTSVNNDTTIVCTIDIIIT